MKEFSVVLNDRDPKMIRSLLDKFLVPHICTPARYLHALMSRQYMLVAGLRTEGQKTQYHVSVHDHGQKKMFTESLALIEGDEPSDWLIFMTSSNMVEAKDLIPAKTVEKSYDFNWTAVSLTNALVGTEDYDVCAPNHNRTMCQLLLAVVEALKDTHYFNVYVTKGMGLELKCISPVDSTVVTIKTRSWGALAMKSFMTQNQNFEGRHTTSIH